MAVRFVWLTCKQDWVWQAGNKSCWEGEKTRQNLLNLQRGVSKIQPITNVTTQKGVSENVLFVFGDPIIFSRRELGGMVIYRERREMRCIGIYGWSRYST